MRYYKRPIDSSWLKAAAIGSLWGSTEIILGSFLHNIKLPMAGSLLTFIAIIYMTIFAYIWKDRLVILKGAVITALLKSLSPSAVLIGPMTAIILEGLLFEIAILAFGRNIVGFAVGGFFTQMSVIIHKIAGLLIVYGNDFIRIVDNLYYFVARRIYIEVPPQQALLYFFLIYGTLGIVASLLGYLAARRTIPKIENRHNEPIQEYFVKPAKINPRPFKADRPGQNAFLILAINIILLVLLLWTIGRIRFAYASFLAIVILGGYYKFYPQAFRIFKKPLFWLQLVVLFILGALFYYDTPSKLMFNPQGFEQSGLMIYRAVIIVVMFGVISIQLNNPRIKSYLLRYGFQNVYITLELAFLTLPKFLEYISEKIDLRIIQRMIIFSFSLVEIYQQNITYRNVFVIEGGLNSGKTTFIKTVIEQLKNFGLDLGGIYTEKEKKQVWNYYVVNILDGQKALLCSEKKMDKYYYKTMRFYFSEYGVDFGIQAIENAINKPLIIIDEVGKLELQNYGWAKMLDVLLDIHKPQLWTVRDRYTRQILRKFMINTAYIFNIKEDKPAEVAEFIYKSIFLNNE